MTSCLAFNLYAVGELKVKLNLLGTAPWILGLEPKYRITSYIFNAQLALQDTHGNVNH